ncbi:MAG TPA: hypothetical protein VK647_04185 [Gemmatimonadales bacterium]|jgi:hypothetical protein|nr:hypothetical protein [Gemmatimonadales bacterium]
MTEIHCHSCGGFIGDPSYISYRSPTPAAPAAVPRSGLCTCGVPIVYGPPPGHSSSPRIPALSAARLANRRA